MIEYPLHGTGGFNAAETVAGSLDWNENAALCLNPGKRPLLQLLLKK
jgi:hypothetical protein